MSLELIQIDLRNLEGGESCTLKGVLLPASLELDHDEAEQFSAIEYKLEVQIVGESLLIRADVKGEKKTPCKICNKNLIATIHVDRQNEIIQLDEIKGYKIDLTPTVRNLFLMEAPGVLECNSGACTDRTEVENFLKRQRLSSSPFDSLT